MNFVELVLMVHVGATWAMVGLIWFVQIVHYPLFASIPIEAFEAYEKKHTVLTTYVVMPLMLAELGTAGLLVYLSPDSIATWLLWTGFAMVVLIWLSTFGIQVPLHQALKQGYDEQRIKRLVASNWLRTFLWTARGVIACMMLLLMIV